VTIYCVCLSVCMCVCAIQTNLVNAVPEDHVSALSACGREYVFA